VSRKVVIIALDGATFDIITPLMEGGWMPCLKKLMQKGACGPLRSTVPPVSGPAWLSLATGMKPEKTLVYDFSYRKSGSYRLQAISADDYAGKAIWDYLGRAGKRVGILNYPMWVPPYEINGFMSAGLGASPDGRFTFPLDLKHELNRAAGGKYELVIGYHKVRYEDTGLFLDDLQRVLAKKLRAATHLLREKQWDLFWVVLSETDWLQHIMWRHLDESHPLYEGQSSKKFHERFKQLWRLIDETIAEFCAIVGQQTNMIILSDHGFGTNDKVCKLNVWLEREGYLVWRQKPIKALNWAKRAAYEYCKAIAKGIKLHKLVPKLYSWGVATKDQLIEKVIDHIDLERSVAFDPGHSIPFGGIYINSQLVDAPQKKHELAKEIARKLGDWGNKNNVKVEIWQKNTLLADEANTGPELLVGINNWRCVVLKEQLNGEILERRPYSSRHTGSHRMNGIFIATGPDIQERMVDHVHIYDVAPTILYLFDQPVPSNMDGEVLREIFSSEYVQENPPKFQIGIANDEGSDQTRGDNNLTSVDEKTIQKQLKDLGYI